VVVASRLVKRRRRRCATRIRSERGSVSTIDEPTGVSRQLSTIYRFLLDIDTAEIYGGFRVFRWSPV